MRVDASIEIDAPPDRVWPIATDPYLASRWNSNVVSVSNVSPGPVRVGTRWTQVVRILGIDKTMQAEVVECSPPWRGVVRMDGPGDPIITTTIDRVGLGSVLTQVMDLSIPLGFSGVAMRLGVPLIKEQLQEALRRQKLEVESGGETH